MFARLTAAALLAGVLLATPAAASTSPQWTQSGYGPGNTYYNPAESVINAGSIDAVRRRWAAPLAVAAEGSCAAPSAPLVSGGRVFASDETGVAAFAAGTGRLIWRHTWPDPEDQSTPHLAVAAGLLLVANQGCQSQSDPNGAILALRVATGRPAWQLSTDIPLQSLVVDRGVAVVSGASESDTPTVLGLRVRDGKRRWELTDHRSPGVVAAGGRLLISSTVRTETRAVSITSGATLWRKPVAWRAEAATPAGDQFYVSGPGDTMLCVGAADGAVRWRAAYAAGTPIAADGRRVYQVVANGIEALDARTGRRAWQTLFEGDTGQPVRAGGLLYTSVDAGEPLGILHAATGKVASSGRQFGNLDGGNVVVAAGWVYLANGNSLRGYAP
jgi:outer membrane protein assembly factor BamB